MLIGYKRKWQLRCRFDFADGRPSWFSQWDKSGPQKSDMAAYQNKTGLVRAAIEGKDVNTRELKVLAECDGHDFCNFEWLAMVVTGASNPFGTFQGMNVGLVLVTRNERCIVESNGTFRVESRTEAEKKIHLAGYGR